MSQFKDVKVSRQPSVRLCFWLPAKLLLASCTAQRLCSSFLDGLWNSV